MLFMNIRYRNSALEKVCTDLKEAKKQYNPKVSMSLHAAINFIQNATSLKDVINYPPFHFHDLQGDRKNQYAIDIAGRKSGYRLIIIPINNSGTKSSKEEIFGKSASNIVIVHLEEVTNHYE